MGAFVRHFLSQGSGDPNAHVEGFFFFMERNEHKKNLGSMLKKNKM